MVKKDFKHIQPTFLNALDEYYDTQIIIDDDLHKHIISKLLEDEEVLQKCGECKVYDEIKNVELDSFILDEIIRNLWNTVNRWMKFKLPFIIVPGLGVFKYNLGQVMVQDMIDELDEDTSYNNKVKAIRDKIKELYNTYYPKAKDKAILIGTYLPFITVERLYKYSCKYGNDKESTHTQGKRIELWRAVRKQWFFKRDGFAIRRRFKQNRRKAECDRQEYLRKPKSKRGRKKKHLSPKEFAKL